jgi:tetratricopeptide (TPR) repeat protein
MSHAAKYLLSYKKHTAKEIKENANIIHLGYISFLIQQQDYEEVKETLEEMKEVSNEYEMNAFEFWRSKYFAKIGNYDMAIKQLHILNKKLKYERHHNNTIVKYFLRMKDTESADRYLSQHALDGENDIQGYNAKMYYAFACAHYEKEEYVDGGLSAGFYISYQGQRWGVMTNGTMNWFYGKDGTIEAGALYDLCLEAMEKVALMPTIRPDSAISRVFCSAKAKPANEPVSSTSASLSPSTILPTYCRLSSSSISSRAFSCSSSCARMVRLSCTSSASTL